MAVATALATGSADAIVAGGRNALGTLLRTISERLGAQPSAAATLRAAVDDPGPQQRARLADLLAQMMADDPEIAARLRSHRDELTGGLTADRAAVVNLLSGRADKAIQARDIHGNLSL